MNRNLLFLLFHSVLAGLALVALLPTNSGAATISAVPGMQDVEIGGSTTIDILISDLGGEIVSAYDLDLLYDASVLLATDVVFGTSLGDELFFEVFGDFDLSVAGLVDFAQLSLLDDDTLFPLQGGQEVVVARVVFEAVATGTSGLSFAFDAFNDVKGRDAAVLPIEAGMGSIRVTDSGAAIPEPSSAVLFAVGLLLTRRRLRS